jgi:crotonobetainyl-CoA:carnitine CoA-transferase CaiB-like acyl-CoA transferase
MSSPTTLPGASPASMPAETGAGTDWLKGLTVVTAGTSVSLRVAARVLAQFGAQVARATASTPLNADIVLVDRISDLRGGLGPTSLSASEYQEYVAERNTAVWVTASAYGLAGSRADCVGSDLTLMASAGILGHSRIGDEWAPTVPPGELGLKMVGYVMAVAALHALHERRGTGAALHVDVSAQAAIIATGLTLEMAHALSECPDEGGSARYGAPSGFFQCTDGSIYVLVLEQHQWTAFRRVLAPALDSVESLVDARDRADFVNAQLTVWASARTAEECERILQGEGVPCTRINTLEGLEESARRAGRPVALTGPDAPALPALLHHATPRAGGGHRAPARLADLRVLDAGHVLAVPLGAAWLGAMGAAVTKLEDPKRLDIYRRRGPFAGGVAGLNRSAYFNQLNGNKTALDVADGEDRLDLGGFDVVLHNLTPRRAKTVGVDSDRVLGADAADDAPGLLISSSGFGSTGNWAGYRAYGHNIHAFAGLIAATRDARDEMADFGTPWADPLTSVAIAAWVLAWSLVPVHEAASVVDISMAELTASQIAELSGADAAENYRAPKGGGSFFLRGRDGKALLAVSIRDEQEAEQFASVVGSPVPETDTLGQLVETVCPDEDITVVEDRLRAAGIPASLVLTAGDLARDQFVRSTGLYQTVYNRDLREHKVTGLPWHFVGRRHPQFRAAPERSAE